MNSNTNNTKVIFLLLKRINLYIQDGNNSRYKTILCKHFNTPQGCSYGDKCQFAHGQNELRQIDNKMIQNPMNRINNNQKNALNYKIVKCKNWEKDRTCKYGVHCTFAHGDEEVRSKSDNLYQMQPGMGVMVQPFMFDMNAMIQMGQMNQLQGMDMTQMGITPLMMGMGIPMNNNGQQPTNTNGTLNQPKNE